MKYRTTKLGPIGWALVPVAMACASACGSMPNNSTTSVSVGAISSSDMMIGIATTQDSFVVYVCGGPATFMTDTRWMSGSLPAGMDFDYSNAGWTVHAHAQASGWTGTVATPDGMTHDFTATAIDSSTHAGLYSVVDEGCRTGVVITQASSADAPRVQGVWCSANSTVEPPQQVTPIVPLEVTAQGVHVQVSTSGAVRDLYVTRVAVPLQ